MEMSNQLADRVGYQLKRAQQALRTAMDEGLRAQGITTPQYAALTALAADEPLSGAELARRCFVTAQTMNAILVGLERARLVERTPHAEHGRVIDDTRDCLPKSNRRHTDWRDRGPRDTDRMAWAASRCCGKQDRPAGKAARQ
jgi:hypothetical protein